jgi:hypothetical protein
MKAALIHFEPAQKARLTRRARRNGKSFSEEVRDAVDLCLALPVESQEELEHLAAEARAATDRMIRKMDDTVARVDRILQRTGAGR